MTDPTQTGPWIRISPDLKRAWPNGVEISIGRPIELRPTERIAILGPSGCGKSTLLWILGALDRPTSGQVEYSLPDNKPLVWKPKGKAENVMSLRRSLGFVYQDARLLPYLTALENILINPLLQIKDGKDIKECLKSICRRMEELGLTSREIDETQIDQLSGFGLKQIQALAKKLGNKTGQYPHELSGGEQSRVALLRALSHNPKVLFADEPTSAIDRRTGELVMNTMRDWASDQDHLLVFVTHSVWEALEYGDRWFGFPEEGDSQYQLHECDRQEVERRLKKRIKMLQQVLDRNRSAPTPSFRLGRRNPGARDGKNSGGLNDYA